MSERLRVRSHAILNCSSGLNNSSTYNSQASYSPLSAINQFSSATALQPKSYSNLDQTQKQIENQEFQQDKFEATKLEIQSKYGTLTSKDSNRLNLLQAKMNDLLQTRLETASRFGHNLSNIAIKRPDTLLKQESLQTKPAHELTDEIQQVSNSGFGQSFPIQRQSKKNTAKPKTQTNFKRENKTYTITAKTLQEAADQISQREEAGETTWKPKYSVKTDENGNVTDATVDVTITVTMPTWPNAAKLPKAAKAEWERALKVLKAHEEKHVKLAQDKLKDVAKSLIGKSEAEAEATFNAALAELQQASDDYDTASDHGRNEGTDLDTSLDSP
ncbi:DUF922 domain-containing protein [Nostoc sp. MS1]|uniref:DUF922 domain-containing protein n=1 Tax=Nostoc sp. MS1 TaxID=2764711 RepID=UPI001CC5D338|nr:DUF922 domain-containing protein [Nostoc sp. MS1]BCL33890.1 hypothetical protein NSMS1_03370 [Nostoc sp. MS1]